MIRCDQLRFAYPGEAFVLEIPFFEVRDAEAVALIGPSGCGKTTLMNLISGVLTPDSGSILIDGSRFDALPLPVRQEFRLRRIGLVPQNFELLDYLTIEENILLPYRLGVEAPSREAVSRRCLELARRAGIEAHFRKYPDQLSQGEKQRAALCRGLVTSPEILLADEPTGNLDPGNQERIVELLLDEARGLGAIVLMITHDPVLLPRFDRVVDVTALRKGGEG